MNPESESMATPGKSPVPRSQKQASGKSARTRERIVDTALALFNEQGAHSVSTRHIAATLGISPGNLYYYFANKEEIIGALYDRIESDLLAILTPPASQGFLLADALGYLERLFSHLWRYRFFYRDMVSLLEAVPGLDMRFEQMSEAVQKSAASIYRAMAAEGMISAGPREIELISRNSWLVMAYWFTYSRIYGRRKGISGDDVRQGILQLVSLFGPYMKPEEHQQVLDALEGYQVAMPDVVADDFADPARKGA